MSTKNTTPAEELNTEQRILEAAARVFTRKGFDATRTRDIAEEADINIASLHYYFRSKQKLFDLVIAQAMAKASRLMGSIFLGDLPLHKKIRTFVPAYIDFLIENPFIPMFILSESQKNSEKIEQMMDKGVLLPNLQQQLQKLSEEGVIRPTSMAEFITNLMGLIVFPFLSKPILCIQNSLCEEDFLALLENRKKTIPEMVINHLYLQPPS